LLYHLGGTYGKVCLGPFSSVVAAYTLVSIRTNES
jgi:hypothetical protein